MHFSELPTSAAWQHRGARSGFEVVFFNRQRGGWEVEGCTTALEGGRAWAVDYSIRVDMAGLTRSARIASRTHEAVRSVVLEADGDGHWLVGGERTPHLDGCLDVDLESSAMTNALPVRRMGLAPGAATAAPAAYVRALDLVVERLEQTYVRVDDEFQQRYDYAAPAFDFACRLGYDESGLVLDYPGIAVRAG